MELKPCPFCGAPAKLKQDPTQSWYLECSLCGVFKGYYKTKKYAIDAWNDRDRKYHADTPAIDALQWISVKNRLPRDGQLVIVYGWEYGRYGQSDYEKEVITTIFYADIGFNEMCGVEYWMPLPEPPVEDKQNG